MSDQDEWQSWITWDAHVVRPSSQQGLMLADPPLKQSPKTQDYEETSGHLCHPNLQPKGNQDDGSVLSGLSRDSNALPTAEGSRNHTKIYPTQSPEYPLDVKGSDVNDVQPFIERVYISKSRQSYPSLDTGGFPKSPIDSSQTQTHALDLNTNRAEDNHSFSAISGTGKSDLSPSSADTGGSHRFAGIPSSTSPLTSAPSSERAEEKRTRKYATVGQKREMCLQALQNPFLDPSQLAADYDIEPELVRSVLRHKEKWLRTSKSPAASKLPKRSNGRFFEIETAMVAVLEDFAARGQPITDEDIRCNALAIARERNIGTNGFKCSDTWIQNFRRRRMEAEELSDSLSPHEGPSEGPSLDAMSDIVSEHPALYTSYVRSPEYPTTYHRSGFGQQGAPLEHSALATFGGVPSIASLALDHDASNTLLHVSNTHHRSGSGHQGAPVEHPALATFGGVPSIGVASLALDDDTSNTRLHVSSLPTFQHISNTYQLRNLRENSRHLPEIPNPFMLPIDQYRMQADLSKEADAMAFGHRHSASEALHTPHIPTWPSSMFDDTPPQPSIDVSNLPSGQLSSRICPSEYPFETSWEGSLLQETPSHPMNSMVGLPMQPRRLQSSPNVVQTNLGGSVITDPEVDAYGQYQEYQVARTSVSSTEDMYIRQAWRGK